MVFSKSCVILACLNFKKTNKGIINSAWMILVLCSLVMVVLIGIEILVLWKMISLATNIVAMFAVSLFLYFAVTIMTLLIVVKLKDDYSEVPETFSEEQISLHPGYQNQPQFVSSPPSYNEVTSNKYLQLDSAYDRNAKKCEIQAEQLSNTNKNIHISYRPNHNSQITIINKNRYSSGNEEESFIFQNEVPVNSQYSTSTVSTSNNNSQSTRQTVSFINIPDVVNQSLTGYKTVEQNRETVLKDAVISNHELLQNINKSKCHKYSDPENQIQKQNCKIILRSPVTKIQAVPQSIKKSKDLKFYKPEINEKRVSCNSDIHNANKLDSNVKQILQEQNQIATCQSYKLNRKGNSKFHKENQLNENLEIISSLEMLSPKSDIEMDSQSNKHFSKDINNRNMQLQRCVENHKLENAKNLNQSNAPLNMKSKQKLYKQQYCINKKETDLKRQKNNHPRF